MEPDTDVEVDDSGKVKEIKYTFDIVSLSKEKFEMQVYFEDPMSINTGDLFVLSLNMSEFEKGIKPGTEIKKEMRR